MEDRPSGQRRWAGWRLALGRSLVRLRAFGLAARLLRAGTRRAPGDPAVWAALGDACARAGGHQEAARAYRKAATLGHPSPLVDARQSAALRRTGATTAALVADRSAQARW